MDHNLQLSALAAFIRTDWFAWEVDRFERDVHILVLGTLDAAMTYLSAELEKDLASLDKILEQATGDYAEHLSDRKAEILEFNDDQERFLRNMAVVALASRLTHALEEMAIRAEFFSARKNKKKYGKGHWSEFQNFWEEYSERFGIDFTANADRIAFVDPMREVRNQIVHDGGKANKYKRLEECSTQEPFDEMIDCTFSAKYKQFVEGDGIGAEVRVTQEQLDGMVNSSLELVRWLAGELYKLQVADAEAKSADGPRMLTPIPQ